MDGFGLVHVTLIGINRYKQIEGEIKNANLTKHQEHYYTKILTYSWNLTSNVISNRWILINKIEIDAKIVAESIRIVVQTNRSS